MNVQLVGLPRRVSQRLRARAFPREVHQTWSVTYKRDSDDVQALWSWFEFNASLSSAVLFPFDLTTSEDLSKLATTFDVTYTFPLQTCLRSLCSSLLRSGAVCELAAFLLATPFVILEASF